MRTYVISDAAVSIPNDTDVQVVPGPDFDVHVMSNRRLNVELGIYEGFHPDFETSSGHHFAGDKMRIGGFQAWRIARDPPGYCGAEILIEVSPYRNLDYEVPRYLHFYYQSKNKEACIEAEKIVRSLQAR